MSEPIATPANISEGSGPPVEPPAIGGKGQEKPFEGMDGKSYQGSQMPAGKPRAPRRRAAAGLTPTEAPDASRESPQVGAAPAQEAKPAAGQEPEPQPGRPTGLEALRHPGESDADFYPRIHQEDRARIRNMERAQEQKEQRFEAALRQAVGEIQRLSGLVQPVVTRQQQEDQRVQQEEMLSRIPDREMQRDEYNTLLAEATLQRQLAWENEQRALREQQAETAKQQAEQNRLEAYLADRDEGIQRELSEATGADATLAQQVHAHLNLTAFHLSQLDPKVTGIYTEDDLEEATYMVHLNEMIEAKRRGVSVADYYREQARVIKEASAMFGGQVGNGNGQQPVQAPAGQPAQADSPQLGSPTAARVAREAQRTQTASGGPGRPGGGVPGEMNLPTRMYQNEDDYVRAGLRNEFDENWVREALGKPAGERASRRR